MSDVTPKIQPVEANTAAAARLDGGSVAVGILAATAMLLLAALVFTDPRSAVASGQIDRSGDYKMLTQEVDNNRELLLILDAAAKKAVYYEFDISRKILEMVDIIPLDQFPVPKPEALVPGRR